MRTMQLGIKVWYADAQGLINTYSGCRWRGPVPTVRRELPGEDSMIGIGWQKVNNIPTLTVNSTTVQGKLYAVTRSRAGLKGHAKFWHEERKRLI